MNFDEMIARAEIWADEQLKKNPQIRELMEEEDDGKLHSEGGRQLDVPGGAVAGRPATISPPDGG